MIELKNKELKLKRVRTIASSPGIKKAARTIFHTWPKVYLWPLIKVINFTKSAVNKEAASTAKRVDRIKTRLRVTANWMKKDREKMD